MSQFNRFAKEAEEVAKNTFKVREEIDGKMKAARDAVSKYPKRTGFGITADYMAKSAKAEADLIEAQQNLRSFQIRTLEKSKRKIAAIREELAEEISEYYSADPHEVDEKTLELLKAGILSVDEYAALYENSNNTMKRIIGSYAHKEAEKYRNGNGPLPREAASLLSIHNKSLTADGREFLKAYDFISDVFNRCCNNPHMVGEWDNLLGETIENF